MKKEKIKKKTISITVTEKLVSTIEKQAEEAGINRSAFVSLAIMQYVSQNKIMSTLDLYAEEMRKNKRNEKNALT